jgi:hypothetical protein
VVEGCSNHDRSRGLCTGHRAQADRGAWPTPLRTFKKKPNGRPTRTRTRDGYIQIQLPEYPGSSSNGLVLEHRYVMEQRLGRLLSPGENVHHRNGVRDDNRPENLELWVVGQPSGQRAVDLVVWAKEILSRYNH